MPDTSLIVSLVTLATALVGFAVSAYQRHNVEKDRKLELAQQQALLQIQHDELAKALSQNTALTKSGISKADRAYTTANGINAKLAALALAQKLAEAEALVKAIEDQTTTNV